MRFTVISWSSYELNVCCSLLEISTPNFHSLKTKMSKINVKIVIQDDAPAVMEHLGEFFCLDEPILRSLKLTPNAKFLSMCCDMINDNISLKAVDDQGNIIGLLLSEIKRRIVVI